MYGIVLFLVAAGACGDDSGTPPAQDAAPASDASSGGDAANFPSLRVDWDAQPQLGTLSTTLSVSKAKFHVDRLQVISDVEDPTQTTARNLTLLWTNVGDMPDSVRFDDAPSALYSKIKLSLDKDQTGTTPTITMDGQVDAGMGMRTFHIESYRPTSIEVSGYTTSLTPGGNAQMGITLDVKHALDNVDWSSLDHPSNTYSLDDTQMAAMDAFLLDLGAAFVRTP
ncbi:MAG TPA: hypothetical protein VGM39_03860 [Kofleriaceae bacterium]